MSKPLIDILYPKHGGKRTPAGGRPRKDHVKWFCYLDKATAAQIDDRRGKRTRGEYITQLIDTAPDQS